MKTRGWVNGVLFVALCTTIALSWLIKERDVRRPNYDFLPEAQMAQSVAYDSFSPNPNFLDGLTLRTPPAGTLARGPDSPLHYQSSLEDALRASQELHNPFAENDTARRERGSIVFTHFCQVCHGPLGQGNGPVTQGGFPPPASLLADRAVQMKDGQMFHVLTYGQQNMPSFAAQMSRADRWSVILHVRMLQGPSVPSSAPSRFQEVARLFRENCAACHGEDGNGSNFRKVWPLIPDFTSLAWQMSQTEMALVNQIQYGSHPLMPAFRYKLTTEQILRLAVYVRSFAAHSADRPAPPSSYMTAANVYGTYCFFCHNTTGRGIPEIREAMPELPNFTDVAWQKSRTDSDLAQSILLGKGKFMKPMSDKLGSVDIKQIVALVRGFQGGKAIVQEEAPKPLGPTVTPEPPPLTAIPDKDSKIEKPKGVETLTAPKDDTGERIRIGASIFQHYCIVCHGQDGKGTLMRPVLPPIPDFTNPAFHKEHSDGQLVVSILDGKGTFMPANRGRVTEEQAGYLMAFVRAFGGLKSIATKPQASDSDFEKAFGEIEIQYNQLQEEYKKMKDRK